MGKARKDKKNQNEDEIDSDTYTDDHNINDDNKGKDKNKQKSKTDQMDGSNQDKKKKKKKGKSRGDEDSDIEQLAKEIEEIEVSKKSVKGKKTNKKQESDDEESESEKISKKKPKTKKISKHISDEESDTEIIEPKSNVKISSGGFALLDVESDPEEEPEDIQYEERKPAPKKGNQKKVSEPKKETGGNKKSKKKKRRNDSDEDEIEKVLAELEMEYAGIKKEPSVDKTESEEVKKTEPSKKKNEKNKKSEEKNVENVSSTKTAQKKTDRKETSEKIDHKQEKATEKVSKETEDKDIKNDDEAKDTKKGKKSGPGKKAIAAMQEALKKMREKEEQLQREEEERIRQEEEAETARLEAIRLEQERKDKKKKKEKERKERLKAEGKLLSAKQKADRARAQAMLEALKAQGVELPEIGEKKPRPGTRIKPHKLKKESSQEKSVEEPVQSTEETKVEVKIVDKEEPKKVEEDVKDSWDAESSGEETSEESKEPVAAPKKQETVPTQKQEESEEDEDEDDEDEDDDESDSENESNEESSDESAAETETHLTDAEKKRMKALARIQKRREEAEKKRTTDDLRAAVVCVLGHVDTGKTKILDKLRRTNVQDGEAGGITQQIGATNVPIENIKEQTRFIKGFAEKELRLPGLLIIDTPGHESFSNLRSRGSSLCDIAILVVDIMHGLEPQTIESINLLKQKRTPFVVALNKIDRLYDWETMSRKDIRDIIKGQMSHTQLEFENRTKEVILQFAEQSLNAALFYENRDPKEYISLVPTSAITGEGMGNLLALIVDMCQNFLAKRLMYSEELQATVLEVKAISGLGTTIDAILINGVLKEGDTMLLAGTDGPIVTQIRSLLMPQPMRELRVKNAYIEHKEIKAAQGVKIAAKELEKAIAGLNLAVAHHPDEVEVLKEEVQRELKSALSNIKLQERGVFVQASTLGSLEALLEFLKSSKIPYAGIRIGPVVKKDVMKASIMLEHDSQYATILAFDVKIERDAQEIADNLGVKIFQADIIYHLFDKFMKYRDDLKKKKRDEFKHIAVFPCKMRVLPQFVFNSRDPIVCGVMIEAGIVKEGTPICVPSKEFVELGIVTSIEINHKQVETARKGQEVCIKIEPIPGEAPKMFGRHFDETDMLVSKISRQSIDACKDYFRDDLIKTDWQLMVELKKQFQIL